MPRSTRKGLYRVIYLVGGRRATVPATLQFDAAMREFAALKRRGFTTWIESDSGEFVPVEGAMRKPKEIVDEHRVADFNSIPELIEHAKGEGASAILVAGQQVTLYFPRRDGRYDAATIWNQNGYWHAPSKSARTIVTRLPAGAESIGSHTQRVGRRASEAPRRRLSRPNLKMTPESALQLAGELSQAVGGSKPRTLPGGYRFSDKNEAAQFTTYSPEYSQKVVCVVSVFEDGSTAIGIFSDEGLSGTATYENITHFTYDGADIPVMKKDIEWVWETVDGYAASWQEDEDGEVDEASRRNVHEAKTATMYQEAQIFINGQFQVGFTFTPTRGPADAARAVLSLARNGDVIEVKQDREVWTYDVTRKPGQPATIVERLIGLYGDSEMRESALTTKEKVVLLAIATSEYRMGPIEDNEAVWSGDLQAAGISPRSMGGVLASLQKKGLIGLYGDGKEATVDFTPEGIAAVQALRGGSTGHHVSEREPSFKRPGARVKYNYTDGPIPPGTMGTIIGFLPKSYQAQIRWDNDSVSNHTPDEYDVIRRK
jgi:hypothetical protein